MSTHTKSRELANAKYISILNIIQGEVDPSQVGRDLGGGGEAGKGVVHRASGGQLFERKATGGIC